MRKISIHKILLQFHFNNQFGCSNFLIQMCLWCFTHKKVKVYMVYTVQSQHGNNDVKSTFWPHGGLISGYVSGRFNSQKVETTINLPSGMKQNENERVIPKLSFSFCFILKWKIFLWTFQIIIWFKYLDFGNLPIF